MFVNGYAVFVPVEKHDALIDWLKDQGIAFAPMDRDTMLDFWREKFCTCGECGKESDSVN
jgi:hypothetical protein